MKQTPPLQFIWENPNSPEVLRAFLKELLLETLRARCQSP